MYPIASSGRLKTEVGKVPWGLHCWERPNSLQQARPMLQEPDAELRAMAQQEVAQLEPEKRKIEDQLGWTP